MDAPHPNAMLGISDGLIANLLNVDGSDAGDA
jgi:hypothetical protein